MNDYNPVNNINIDKYSKSSSIDFDALLMNDHSPPKKTNTNANSSGGLSINNNRNNGPSTNNNQNNGSSTNNNDVSYICSSLFMQHL